VLLGDSRYRYDSAHYLLATVELPVVGQVLEASAERPYLITGPGGHLRRPEAAFMNLARS
jgi:hypothetical protein